MHFWENKFMTYLVLRIYPLYFSQLFSVYSFVSCCYSNYLPCHLMWEGHLPHRCLRLNFRHWSETFCLVLCIFMFKQWLAHYYYWDISLSNWYQSQLGCQGNNTTPTLWLAHLINRFIFTGIGHHLSQTDKPHHSLDRSHVVLMQ